MSTRVSTLRVAMELLKRFETEPENYNPAGLPHEQPIYLDAPLAEEFLLWSRDTKKNSREWLEKQQRYLAWWADHLKGVDLRKLSLMDHINPLLKTAGNVSHQMAVLKSLYSWLREEKHLLSVHEDPTFQTLVVPQARPEQKKLGKVIPGTSRPRGCPHPFRLSPGIPSVLETFWRRDQGRTVLQESWWEPIGSVCSGKVWLGERQVDVPVRNNPLDHLQLNVRSA